MGQSDESPNPAKAEHRFLPTLTILILIVLPFLLPRLQRHWTAWVLAAAGSVLLAAVVFIDPGRIDRRSRLVRRLSVLLLLLLMASAIVATATLVAELIEKGSNFDSAGALLLTGLLVWLDTNLTFSLLYWELDGGGAAERLHSYGSRQPDLAFVARINPELAPPDWRPMMSDYLYLGLTNALAFSPTDVMPLTGWAKLTMAVQSLISLVILSLVIATAVNLLG
jgi:uncharacterized membrane protein